jgi:hypothetical protein
MKVNTQHHNVNSTMTTLLIRTKAVAVVVVLFVLVSGLIPASSHAQSGLLSGGAIQLNGSTSGSATITVPDTLTSSFTLPLPRANPASSLYLYDSSGVLKWGTPSTSIPSGAIDFDVSGTLATEQRSSSNSSYLFNVSYAPGATGPLSGAVLVSEIGDANNTPSVASGEIYAENTSTSASGVTVTAMNIIVGDSGSGTQIGVQAEAYGYGNNYAMLFNGGNVGIGTSTPAQPLEVNGNIRISGTNGLNITEGTNGEKGTATLAAGTVTVATTKVTANSRIFLTEGPTISGTPGSVYVNARTAGTSFTIKSTSGTDASHVSWMIVEPGP